VTALVWDKKGERLYETGVDRCVLYKPDVSGDYTNGYAWNGLTAITESPTGGEANAQYADNIKYLNLYSAEEFGATLEAFTYPDAWAECDGSATPEPGISVGQQTRKSFGLSYRSILGNDLEAADYGYKLHLVYGATASPSEKAYSTVNDSPEATAFSWDMTTVPVAWAGGKPTSILTIDSTKVDSTALAALEEILYGTLSVDPRLPSPDDVIALFSGSVTTVTPTASTYDSGTDLVTIPSVVGVIYKMNGVVKTAGTHAITADVIVQAFPAAGYKFPPIVDDRWTHIFA
jgi:hypothetical protein